MKDEEDVIVSIAVPPVGGDPFISLLTKKGNLLIYHYEVIQYANDYKRHLVYLQSEYPEDLSLICKCKELCPGIKDMTPEAMTE